MRYIVRLNKIFLKNSLKSHLSIICCISAIYNLTSCFGGRKETVNPLPKVTIESIEALTSSKCRVKARITDQGKTTVSAAGVAWSTSTNPTINDNDKKAANFSTSTFTIEIDGLSTGTTYFVRAYATNESGTGYSEQRQMLSRAYTEPGVGVTDIDGNNYATIVLGNGQEWMKENLKTTRYRNGDTIASNLTNVEWSTTNEGAYAIYNNNKTNDEQYGKLYNFSAVVDPRGLCPAGWHVPSDEEWNQLEEFVGVEDGGGKLKAVSTLWNNPNMGANNNTDFSALPGGQRSSNGSYFSINNVAFFWTSTALNTSNAWGRSLSYQAADIRRNNSNRRSGFSIRCVKD